MQGYDKILGELKSRGADHPDLAETVALYVDLISAQARANVVHCNVGSIAEIAATRLDRGLPILAPEEFQPDPVALRQLCKEIGAITARHRPELGAVLEAIRAWLDKEQASILTMAAEYLRDEGEVRRGEEAGLDGPLLAFVLNHALHPFLRRYARALAPFVDEGIWYRPCCPICGGAPDFAALAKETGTRQLQCSHCDTEWDFWRVTCPFCGCDDPEKQKYSTTDDRMYRLCECEECGRYLQTIDLREVEGERLLPVERILTMGMDVAAREAGFATA